MLKKKKKEKGNHNPSTQERQSKGEKEGMTTAPTQGELTRTGSGPQRWCHPTPNQPNQPNPCLPRKIVGVTKPKWVKREKAGGTQNLGRPRTVRVCFPNFRLVGNGNATDQPPDGNRDRQTERNFVLNVDSDGMRECRGKQKVANAKEKTQCVLIGDGC